MPWAWIQTIRIPTTLQGGRMGQAEQRRSRQIARLRIQSVGLEETDHRTGRPIRTAKIELVEQSDVTTEDILAAEATVGDDTAARSPIPLVERARVPSCRRETSAGIGSAELPAWTCDRQPR
jgi:hypothetical protein